MHKPLVIVFEGMDYSGKTTVTERLSRELNEAGYHTALFRDPGSTILSERIRAIVKDKTVPCTPEQQLLLFTAARSALAEAVNAALANGKHVLLDRWVYSTVAYQSFGGGISRHLIENLAVTFAPVVVNHAIYLDVRPDEAAARKASRAGNEADRFDQSDIEFKDRVRLGYETQVRERKLVRIDANGPVDVVYRSVIGLVWFKLTSNPD